MATERMSSLAKLHTIPDESNLESQLNLDSLSKNDSQLHLITMGIPESKKLTDNYHNMRIQSGKSVIVTKKKQRKVNAVKKTAQEVARDELLKDKIFEIETLDMKKDKLKLMQ